MLCVVFKSTFSKARIEFLLVDQEMNLRMWTFHIFLPSCSQAVICMDETVGTERDGDWTRGSSLEPLK